MWEKYLLILLSLLIYLLRQNNNKIFKHFYNFNIDGGFDARTKITTKLELNFLEFKTGVLQLNGVKMKNNQANSYNVTFFGNTINLKTLLAEDKLDVLDLSAFDHTYSKTEVKSQHYSSNTLYRFWSSRISTNTGIRQ